MKALKYGVLAALMSVGVQTNAEVILTDATTPAMANTTQQEFTFSSLAAHDSVWINFDLYAFDSLDGNGPSGPDTFGVKVDGIEIFSATFSNFDYGNETNTETFTTIGNYNGINTWGPVDRFFDDYAGGFEVAHTASDLAVEFFVRGLQSITDESFQVVDIDISTANSEPPQLVSEPSGLALIGLGLLGFAASRRKRAK